MGLCTTCALCGVRRYIDKLEASWTEQRLYIDKAVSSLPSTTTAAALRTAIEHEFATSHYTSNLLLLLDSGIGIHLTADCL